MTDSEGTRVAEVTVRWVVCRKHADLFFRRNILTSRLPFGIRLRTFFAGKQPASTVTSRHSVCLASASPALAPAAWPVRNPARHVRGLGLSHLERRRVDAAGQIGRECHEPGQPNPGPTSTASCAPPQNVCGG